jgi:chromosome segregation ATPase
MLLALSLLHLQLIVTFFIGVVTPVLVIVITNYFNKHKKQIDIEASQMTIHSQLSENLWKEIGRLQQQIEILQEREKKAEAREYQLLEKIQKLQTDNIKQSLQIEQLERELKDIKKNETT